MNVGTILVWHGIIYVQQKAARIAPRDYARNVYLVCHSQARCSGRAIHHCASAAP